MRRRKTFGRTELDSMAGKEVKFKKTSYGRSIIFSAILYFVCCIAFTLLLIFCLKRDQYDITIGSPSPATIVAPEKIIDETATDNARKYAAESIIPVYRLDREMISETVSECKETFSTVMSVRSEANAIREETSTEEENDDRSWQVIISQDHLIEMFSGLPFELPEASLGYYLLSCKDEELDTLSDYCVPILEETLLNGVTEEDIQGTLQAQIKLLQTSAMSARQKQFGELIFRKDIDVSYTIDEDATEKIKNSAVGEVAPITIPKGAVIIREGDIVTSSQYDILFRLGYIRGNSYGRTVIPISILLTALLYIIMMWSCFTSCKEMLTDNGRSGMLSIILIFSALLQYATYHMDPRLQIVSLPVILTATLYPRKVSEKLNVMVGIIFGLLAGGRGASIFGCLSVAAIVASLIGGECAILLISRPGTERRSVLMAGAIDGIVSAMIVLLFDIAYGSSFSESIVFSLMMLLSPIIMSALTLGTSAALEHMFDITSNSGLRELTASEHPLIQKLRIGAPGTYHHSLMVATLAENASRAIGADVLMTRAGALFHDVGKIRHPLFFSENQNGANVHDEWDPEKSARTIIDHVADAEMYLKKAGVPSDVRRIVSEHHGTTLVAYFYHKACIAEKERTVDESIFRYPGPVPSTRESVIVMLADSCEAAVRSLGSAPKEAVMDMIKKVIRGKMDDGQFDNAPITFTEMKKIEKSFILTLSGMRHERIAYPDDGKNDTMQKEEGDKK